MAKKLGEYLVAAGKITQKQLDVALAAQAERSTSGGSPPLGTILVEQGAIGHNDLAETLLKQQADRMKSLFD